MKPVPVPPASRLQGELASAYFQDAYEAPLHDTDKSALELYLAAVARTPSWINVLMTVRNRVVALFGLKDLGRMGAVDPDKPAASYKPGDRLGIFSILSLSQDELILGDADKHLRAQVSIYREAGAHPRAVASTVVHVHNLLGRIYLFFVVPVHRRIVPAMLARIAAAENGMNT